MPNVDVSTCENDLEIPAQVDQPHNFEGQINIMLKYVKQGGFLLELLMTMNTIQMKNLMLKFDTSAQLR